MTRFLIDARHLFFKVQHRIILQDVCLSIESKQLITLIGPNGSGKSTLLKILLGLIRPMRGVLVKKPGLKIGYMPQKLDINNTLPLCVEDFLKLSCKSYDIDRTLECVNMSLHRKTQMYHLSGGEFQRILLAKALLNTPDLLVLDEPVQGVDVIGQAEIYHLIQTIRDTMGCGVLLVSHDLHFVHSASDHVICLNHHICCQGRPEDIQKNPSYLSLFGQTVAMNMALYTHTHDHRHDESCLEDTKNHAPH